MLDTLNPSDVHADYSFEKISPLPQVELSVSKTTYTFEVELDVPADVKRDANWIYFRFILLVWNSKDANCRHAAESTPWISLNDKGTKYTTVKFNRKANDTEYLFACMNLLGVNMVEKGWSSTGMRFMLSGSVTKEGNKLLIAKRAAAEAAKKAVPVKEVVKEKPRLKLREKK